MTIQNPFEDLNKTDDHLICLNPGGMMILPLDTLGLDEMIEEEGTNAQTLTNFDETITLSIQELFQIAEMIEKHRPWLSGIRDGWEVLIKLVAQAWLEEFTKKEPSVCTKKVSHEWSDVRYQARTCLTHFMVNGGNEIITGWYTQARLNRSFTVEQQEVLLLRAFKRLYEAEYTVSSEEEEETGE